MNWYAFISFHGILFGCSVKHISETHDLIAYRYKEKYNIIIMRLSLIKQVNYQEVPEDYRNDIKNYINDPLFELEVQQYLQSKY